jgi:hypothetical protein
VALNIKPGLNENPTSLEFPSGRDWYIETNQKSDFHETWDERYVIIGHLNAIPFTSLVSNNNMKDARTCVIAPLTLGSWSGVC